MEEDKEYLDMAHATASENFCVCVCFFFFFNEAFWVRLHLKNGTHELDLQYPKILYLMLSSVVTRINK